MKKTVGARVYNPSVNSFPQRPTLADVAAAAGVSRVTVSRVVEGSPQVSATTRKRVEQAMDRLGYFGNAAASQLVSGRARTVGIVTSNVADYGYACAIRGIEQRARLHDMAVLIVVIEGAEADLVRKTVATLAGHALAGVIAMDWDPTAHAVVPALPAYLPVVSTKPPVPGAVHHRPHVSIDERAGAHIAVDHLIKLGHRAIFVLGPPNDDPQDGRCWGALDALTDARLPHYPVVRCADWSAGAGYAAACTMLDGWQDQITAVSCANDQIAVGTVRAIFEHGLRVPEDISVVGFDNDPLAAFGRPSLTTMNQDFVQLGERAFDLLLDVIAGAAVIETPPEIPTLVVRESTAPPPRR